MTSYAFLQGMGGGMLLVVLLVSFLVYFLPSFVAKGNNNFNTVLIVNILLGWTLLGWVIAFILAFADSKSTVVVNASKADKYDQLQRLNELREKGVITTEEFIVEKEKIMKG